MRNINHCFGLFESKHCILVLIIREMENQNILGFSSKLPVAPSPLIRNYRPQLRKNLRFLSIRVPLYYCISTNSGADSTTKIFLLLPSSCPNKHQESRTSVIKLQGKNHKNFGFSIKLRGEYPHSPKTSKSRYHARCFDEQGNKVYLLTVFV